MELSPYSVCLMREFRSTGPVCSLVMSLLVTVVAVSLTHCNCNLHIFSVTFQV
jgi:hypothetical protein